MTSKEEEDKSSSRSNIERFFQDMISKHVDHEMIQYLCMASFRIKFVESMEIVILECEKQTHDPDSTSYSLNPSGSSENTLIIATIAKHVKFWFNPVKISWGSLATLDSRKEFVDFVKSEIIALRRVSEVK